MEKGIYTNTSYLTLRRVLGLLGMGLPLVLIVGNGFNIQYSISHFYYTRMNVFFVGILWAFGLFLFTYRGYEKKGEKLSDNFLTNVAGILAILTAVIPTNCYDSCAAPNGHQNDFLNLIHLCCAGGFLTIMGWMAYFRFTKGDNIDALKKKRNTFYRIAAFGVWIPLAILGIEFTINMHFTKYDVFIGETITLLFFGAAWLVKGKALKGIGL